MSRCCHIREVLDQREAALVERVLAVLDDQPGTTAAEGALHVRGAVARIAELWRAVDAFPRARECQRLGPRRRDLRSLMDTFAHVERYSLEAVLPTRASLSRSYGMAKFNLARMLRYVVADFLTGSAESQELTEAVDAVERSAAATIIAEDTLRAIASDTDHPRSLRRRATGLLAELWDTWATRGLRDFAPLLDSAWQAKSRVRIAYGTLEGVTELFQLIRNGCDPSLVDHFSSDGASPEQHEAFEEFLFNATHEELLRMRRYMKEHRRGAIGAQDVARIFHVELERLHTTTGTAQDMFFTFRERETWAAHRRLRDLPGPKKTAEEYVMIFAFERRHEPADLCAARREEPPPRR